MKIITTITTIININKPIILINDNKQLTIKIMYKKL